MEPDCILRQRPHNYCPSLAFIARATKNSLICFLPHCKSNNTCEALRRHKQNPVQNVRHLILMFLTHARIFLSHPVPCRLVPSVQCSSSCETASRQILMNLLCVCICFCFCICKDPGPRCRGCIRLTTNMVGATEYSGRADEKAQKS